MYLTFFKTGKKTLQCVLLMETHVGIAITVLNADDQVSYYGYSRFAFRHAAPLSVSGS